MKPMEIARECLLSLLIHYYPTAFNGLKILILRNQKQGQG